MMLCLALIFPIAGIASPGQIISDEAVAFEQPDFDAKALFQFQPGDQIDVSQRSFPGISGLGVFHRVKLPSGKLAFISDADFEFKEGKVKAAAPKNEVQKKEIKKESKSEAKIEDVTEKPSKRAFSLTRFAGVLFDYVGYKEQTMGIQPMSNVVFYGMKMVGPNVIVEGDLITEVNVSLLPSAPPFYSEAANSANGWVLHADMEFDSQFLLSPDFLSFIGFGPMLKYDHYNVSLTSGGKTSNYDMDDMNIGAVFSAGLGFRLWKTSLRAELKYNWEKTQYWDIGTSVLFPF